MKYIRCCFIGLLLIIQNANAACEAQYNSWLAAEKAYDESLVATGAFSVVGTLCTLPLFGVGGLIFGGSAAVCAKHNHEEAQRRKAEYDSCMDRHRRDEEARIAREAEIIARAQKKQQWAYEWSMNQAIYYRESAISVAGNTAIWVIEKKIKAMESDGINLSDSEVIQVIESLRTDISKQLEAYKKEITDKFNERVEKIEKAWANKEEPSGNCTGGSACSANCENSPSNWYYKSVGFPQPYDSFRPSVN